MAKDYAAAYRIKPGARVDLGKRDPGDVSRLDVKNKKAARDRTDQDAREIDALQDRLYAEGKRALLVVLQGIDTSGKDGTVRGVFHHVGPLGVVVTPFGRPSKEELAHDFLWRAHLAVPKRGFIGIFNRSHYEDVLVVRVRKLIPPAEVELRYDQINTFEKILVENGVTVLKFMLHISKQEQADRLKERLAERKSQWKFNPDDLDDRKLWDKYQEAYQMMLARCSTAHAPWHVIPADHKWARNAAIARIVRETLENMNPQYPRPPWNPKDFVIR
jgi:PPK2 family polyphosphate:nucleotide phosphotransferase